MGVVYDAVDPELDRRVAVKQLLPGAGADAQVRLLREAQALARITHPNVVPVFDVGEHGQTVFLAMERVPGQTLKAWLATPRPWREVLRVFLDAGRGLAAAHAVNLVHRDFKPSNVLVGNDGRVRVMDFGVAREADLEAPPVAEAPAPRREGETSGVWDEQLTEEGSLVGTLAYLAPEQVDGKTAEARSDQFAFCVALYEAVFRVHPFGMKHRLDLARAANAALAGEFSPPAPGARAPRWLRALLRRGLAKVPEQRYPSMDALLAELQRHLARRPRWVAVAAGLAIAAGLGGAFLARSSGPPPCTDGGALLLGVWDEGARQAVAAALAQDASRVEARLDEWSRAWVDARNGSCAATRVRHEASEDVLLRRLACLDRRRQDLTALVGLLRTADAALREDAVDAAWGLEPPGDCLEGELSREGPALPTDEAQRAAISNAYQRLAEAKALREAGRHKQALPRAREGVTAAEGMAWPALQVEALQLLGALLRHTDDAAGAERAFEDSYFRAEAAGLERLAAQSAIHLVFLLSTEGQRFAEAERWLKHARALHAHLEGEAAADSRLSASTGSLLAAQGRYAEAKKWLEAALARQAARAGEDDPATAAAHNNLGAALARLGEHDEAERHYRSALATYRTVRGSSHPSVATALHNLALLLSYRGHYAAAEKDIREALSIQVPALGEKHKRVATSSQVLAHVLTLEGRCEEAAPLQALALEVLEPAARAPHPRAVVAHADRAACFSSAGDAGGRVKEAKTALQQARAMSTREPAPFALALIAAAEAELSARHPERALPLAEEALAELAASPADMMLLARVRFVAARSLRALHRDEQRALELARLAQDALTPPDVEATALRAEVERFLGGSR